MKLEEVLPAFRAGKKIRVDFGDGVFMELKSFHELAVNLSARTAASDDWSIVEEPATDEELAAAFEARSMSWFRAGKVTLDDACGALTEAADMVRKRCVDPSWKAVK